MNFWPPNNNILIDEVVKRWLKAEISIHKKFGHVKLLLQSPFKPEVRKEANVSSPEHLEYGSRGEHTNHGKNHLQLLLVRLSISFLVIVDNTKYCFVGLICIHQMVGCIPGGGKAC